jgi:hypothetical protein
MSLSQISCPGPVRSDARTRKSVAAPTIARDLLVGGRPLPKDPRKGHVREKNARIDR